MPTSGGVNERGWWARMAITASSPMASHPRDSTTITGTRTKVHTVTWLITRTTIGSRLNYSSPAAPSRTFGSSHTTIRHGAAARRVDANPGRRPTLLPGCPARTRTTTH